MKSLEHKKNGIFSEWSVASRRFDNHGARYGVPYASNGSFERIVLFRRLVRIYILKGFPSTETEAAQFLEENHAHFASSAKGNKEKLQQCLRDRTEFLSCLDAVVQLTTR